MSEALHNPEVMLRPGLFNGTVLETIGVVVEPTNQLSTPASQIPHEVPTRSGEGHVQIQDDSFKDYFIDE